MSENKKICAISQDPIYIGTGGFTIGRVDNTIVRDPVTRIPKIPGTSLAGTWRYYMALTLHSYFKEYYKINRSEREDVFKSEGMKGLFKDNVDEWVKNFEGNRYTAIKCAGQDDESNSTIKDSQKSGTGHCGSCIVCKTFGFSKGDKAQRGMAYFSDLNILLFPVYTRLGTRWITSKQILQFAGIEIEDILKERDEKVAIYDKGNTGLINLGWLNFKVEDGRSVIDNMLEQLEEQFDNVSELNISKENIIIVSDNIIHQIINSNLETRTSVSIDPLNGTAKEGALFTSEAIPRGTVFYGEIRIEEHPLEKKPTLEQILNALKDSKKYFETLGIGGMTTRGFGRLKILNWGEENGKDWECRF